MEKFGNYMRKRLSKKLPEKFVRDIIKNYMKFIIAI